ncbi:MAG: hypothetical protein QMC77_02475 [Methanocellales archaeon]|nr:hypothetical protein [Methanocellales archaeon]
MTPNVFEAALISGMKVIDRESAKKLQSKYMIWALMR